MYMLLPFIFFTIFLGRLFVKKRLIHNFETLCRDYKNDLLIFSDFKVLLSFENEFPKKHFENTQHIPKSQSDCVTLRLSQNICGSKKILNTG